VGKVVIAQPAASQQARSSDSGLVLVTGGLGNLGGLLAQWLVQQGAQHVALLGRSGKASSLAAQPDGGSVFSSDACVQMIMADVAVAEDLQRVFVALPRQAQRPVGLVLHAGGVLADATLGNQSMAAMRRVAAPKSVGAAGWQLAVQQQPAGSQVFFSSIAALLGSPGQANYAAANAALDAAAQALQAQGVAAVSVQWGAWAGAGMAAQDAQTAARVERMGMAMIQPQRGLAALSDALQALHAPGACAAAHAPAALAAIPFRWPAFLARQAPVPAFFSEFASMLPAASGAQPAALRPTQPAAAAAAATVRLAAVPEQVGEAVASILGRRVGEDEPLVAAGLDSLGSVELRNALQVGTLP
jgi:NADP-dependent 3-hydroxy acid dehydrogenase YdfG